MQNVEKYINIRNKIDTKGVTAEYPATLYHYCFRWSVFF